MPVPTTHLRNDGPHREWSRGHRAAAVRPAVRKPGSDDDAVKRGALAALVGLLVLLAGSSPAAEGPFWRIARGDVRVVVPLKPGGAFEATTSSFNGTLTLGASKPVSLKGEISVELRTLDTGIGLRNQHLRDNYLEVSKPGLDKAVLTEIRLNDADGEAFQGRTGFTGMLLLHGVRRQVAGTAVIRREGSGVSVEASFPLALTDFGIKPPEYLGVGVGNKLIVKVLFAATPA